MQQPPGGWGPQGPPPGGYPPPGYGQGYGPPQQQGYGPPQYPPQPPQVVYVQAPKAGISCGEIFLWTLLAVVVLNVGGCVACMTCTAVGAASSPTHHR